MKKAAAYLRVSDERQDEFSPDSQLGLIKEYCAGHDLELPEEFIFYDDGISAKSSKNRKQFCEMIALAKQKDKPFETILVWKFSRFARNQEESIVYKAMLRKNGVDVVSVSEPIADNPFGGLIERIIEWMDEYYLIRLSDEVRRGMTERATRGLPNTAPPFGYHMKDGHYVVSESEASVVRGIFEMYTAGKRIREIAAHLKSIGVKSRYGNDMDGRAIDYILNNPCYIGYVRWNPNGRSASKRIFHNPEDIVKKAAHTPIISKDIFEKAQQITALRKKTHQKYARENAEASVFMLKGIVKCHTCGSTLVYQKAQSGLQCHQYARGSCGVSHYISLRLLDQMVIASLKDILGALTLSIEIPPEASCSIAADYDTLIHAERTKLSRAKQAYQDGIDTLEEYKIEKEKREANIKSMEAEKQRATENAAKKSFETLPDTACLFTELLESTAVSEELKNIALKTILRQIILYKPERHIELHFYT